MKRFLLLLVPFLVSTTFSLAMVVGATVEVIETSPETHTATIRVQNNTEKQITGYGVKVERLYADGTTDWSENSTDFGPHAVAGFGPGKTNSFSYGYDGTGGKTVIQLKPQMVAVIYDDQTAEGDPESLDRIVSVRRRMAEGYKLKLAVAQAALADPKPGEIIDNALKNKLIERVHDKDRHGDDSDLNCLKELATEVDSQPEGKQKAYLQRRIPELEREAEMFAAYSNVRTQQ